MFEHSRTMLHRAPLGIGGGIIKPRNPCVRNRPCTHRARFQRDKKIAGLQPFCPQDPRCFANHCDLRMSGWVVPGPGQVMSAGDHCAIVHDHRPHRHFTRSRSGPRLIERSVHRIGQGPAFHVHRLARLFAARNGASCLDDSPYPRYARRFPRIFPHPFEREIIMSRICELTGKGRQVGHNVSHANNKTKRVFLPNLQNVTLLSEKLDRSFKFRVSTQGLRSVEHNGGLDNWLLKTADTKLSPRARKVKREIAKVSAAA